MRVTTTASGLVFDDARLGPPITLKPLVLTLFINRPVRHILNFYVQSNSILCLECGKQAANFDALVPIAFSSITLNARPPATGANAHSARAVWQSYLAAPGILSEPAFFTGRPHRRFRINIRGDVNYARSI